MPRGRLLLGALAVATAACASGATPDDFGPSGLEGALPGGDGRALRAYRSEYQGNVLQAMDSVLQRLQDAWRGSSADAVASLFGAHASVVEPGGATLLDGVGVGAWAEAALPRTSSMSLWRDLFTASGEMAVTYGRYEAVSAGSGDDHAGFHLTVAKREGRDWKVRSQVFLSFEGAAAPMDPDSVASAPEHITPEVVRGRRGNARRARVRSALAEYSVNAYYRANSLLARWRYHWNQRDLDAMVDLLAPDAVVRLPWDVPAVGRSRAELALRRFVPAVGALHMSILDFDVSERVSYCLGRYTIDVPNDVLTGPFIAVFREEDDGPQLRAILLAGAGTGGTVQ